VHFPKGTNQDLKLMEHLWEPLRVVHKPLVIHIAAEMSIICTHLALQVRGAQATAPAVSRQAW
jgi:hypothetical protein